MPVASPASAIRWSVATLFVPRCSATASALRSVPVLASTDACQPRRARLTAVLQAPPPTWLVIDSAATLRPASTIRNDLPSLEKVIRSMFSAGMMQMTSIIAEPTWRDFLGGGVMGRVSPVVAGASITRPGYGRHN